MKNTAIRRHGIEWKSPGRKEAALAGSVYIELENGKPTHVTEVGTAVTGGRESGEAGNVLETHFGKWLCEMSSGWTAKISPFFFP